jgi:hypothetical protein
MENDGDFVQSTPAIHWGALDRRQTKTADPNGCKRSGLSLGSPDISHLRSIGYETLAIVGAGPARCCWRYAGAHLSIDLKSPPFRVNLT